MEDKKRPIQHKKGWKKERKFLIKKNNNKNLKVIILLNQDPSQTKKNWHNR